MTGGFSADADRIGARSRDFGDHAQRARKVAESLQAGVGDQPWGDDAVGQSFAAAHSGPAEKALQLLTGLGGELDAMGAKFADAAQTYRVVDESGAGDADAVRREVGEA